MMARNILAIRATAAAVLILSGAVARAQLLEDVDYRREGANAVVQVKLAVRVNFLRALVARSGDLAQTFYDVLPQQQLPSTDSGERRVQGGGGIPSLIITDEPASTSGTAALSRKLVVRLSAPAKIRMRAGRDNRSIEIVLEGLGASVAQLAAKPQTATADAPKPAYYITLQSSDLPGSNLEGSVPAKLQDFEIFTATRSIAGKNVYEINLGYFANQSSAQEALDLVKPRFPKALIVDSTTQTGKPFAAAPSSPSSATAPAVVQPAPPSVAPAQASATAPAPALASSSGAEELLKAAQSAYDSGDTNTAVEKLNQLLALPPNASSRRAQELIGQARLKAGDTARARAEFELFLSLYPTGDDSRRVQETLAGMGSAPVAVAATPAQPEAPPSPWSGSLSAFYYGGQARTRSQDFQDSPLSGLPQPVGENTLSSVDQRQVQIGTDLNWRQRNSESDSRFTLRNSYTRDLIKEEKSKNRLSALFWDYRALKQGANFKVGRQSPTGGGVLNRFDGAQAGYLFAPKWRINAVAGVPTEKLLDTKRRFFGTWIDAEALTPEISGSFYFNQQDIDGQIDRRAVGTELRYFSGGVSMSSQLDYDIAIRGLNIASIQGTWQLADNTVYNFLYDYRATAMLSLGNMLFFQDPNLTTPARRVQDLLRTSSLQALRDQVKSITGYQTQALVGVTTPLNTNWQIGGDIRLTNTDEVKPVAVILPSGQPSTGNLWSAGLQLIGTNLYSSRDTHVFSTTVLSGPTNKGVVLGYNNLSNLGNGWQLEPSLKFDRQTDDTGLRRTRWTPGMRVSYRLLDKASLESELTYERSNSNAPQRTESGSQVFYYFGLRYDL
jgi:tetratricopeptide (TPR) repeat protein